MGVRSSCMCVIVVMAAIYGLKFLKFSSAEVKSKKSGKNVLGVIVVVTTV